MYNDKGVITDYWEMAKDLQIFLNELIDNSIVEYVSLVKEENYPRLP